MYYFLPKCDIFVLDGFVVVAGIRFKLYWDLSQTNETFRLSEALLDLVYLQFVLVLLVLGHYQPLLSSLLK